MPKKQNNPRALLISAYIMIGLSLCILITAAVVMSKSLAAVREAHETQDALMHAPAQDAQQTQDPYAANVVSDNLQVRETIERVTRHMLIPDGDVTVATVHDAQALKNQNPVFFQALKNGDKLIYYAHGIIMYDPQADRIVDVIRLFTNAQSQNTASAGTSSEVSE